MSKRIPRPKRVPRQFPSMLEIEPDRFRRTIHATLAEWRRAAKVTTNEAAITTNEQLRQIRKMVRIADRLGLPDDAILLDALKDISEGRLDYKERIGDNPL